MWCFTVSPTAVFQYAWCSIKWHMCNGALQQQHDVSLVQCMHDGLKNQSVACHIIQHTLVLVILYKRSTGSWYSRMAATNFSAWWVWNNTSPSFIILSKNWRCADPWPAGTRNGFYFPAKSITIRDSRACAEIRFDTSLDKQHLDLNTDDDPSSNFRWWGQHQAFKLKHAETAICTELGWCLRRFRVGVTVMSYV